MERKVFPKLCPKFNTSMPLSAADVNRIWWLGSWLVFRVTFKIPEVEEDDLDDHDCQGGRWPTPGGLDSRRRTGKIKNSFFRRNIKFSVNFSWAKILWITKIKPSVCSRLWQLPVPSSVRSSPMTTFSTTSSSKMPVFWRYVIETSIRNWLIRF